MKVLIGSSSERKWAPIFQRYPDLGMMLSPLSWRSPWCPIYACDNDVFGHQGDARWWGREGEAAWLQMLDKVTDCAPPLFCLLPDVVGDWPTTLDHAEKYLPELRSRRLPVALALQDGCAFEHAAAVGPDWVFVGGSTDWKEMAIRPACDYFRPLGIGVHVGRVNGGARLRLCMDSGAHSVDGTGWGRFSDAMLPVLAGTIERYRAQTRFSFVGGQP